MKKFKNGERVVLLAKTCGNVHSLDSMIQDYYKDKISLVNPSWSGFSHYRKTKSLSWLFNGFFIIIYGFRNL